jgi:hypothetical protein
MADDRKLIEQVTQQVLWALKQGKAAPAPIHPPAGTCAGDYSQFTDMKARTTPAQTTSEPAAATAAPILTGVVTAKQLDQLTGSVVRLSSSARLTPLAVDIVKERKLTVERVASASASSSASAPASGGWVWWIDGHCPQAEQTAADLRSSLTALSHRRSGQAMPEVIRDVARRAATGRLAGAVLFVPSAVKAAVMANRCPTLRAIVGTSVNAAEEGVRQVAANVLLIEYPQHGGASMRAMIQAFLAATRPDLPEVERQLKELGTCA